MLEMSFLPDGFYVSLVFLIYFGFSVVLYYFYFSRFINVSTCSVLVDHYVIWYMVCCFHFYKKTKIVINTEFFIKNVTILTLMYIYPLQH